MHAGQWLVAAGVVIACAVVVSRAFRQRRDRQALAGLARRLDLVYAPHDPLDLPARYRVLAIFRRGHNRRAGHVIRGARPLGALCCFRYEYEVGLGTNRQIRRWGVAVVESDMDLPLTSVGPAPRETTLDDAWLDPVPDGMQYSARRGAVQIDSVLGDTAAPLAVEWADWVGALDGRCRLETHGRLIAVVAADPVSPDGWEWLVRVAGEATGRIRNAVAAHPPRES